MTNPETFWLARAKPDFLQSVPLASQLPVARKEVAFFGRSNAGKSSFINCLANRKQLAKTSNTPGKTQSFTVYTVVPETSLLIDLPGYGYAAVAKHIKKQWPKQITDYMQARSAFSAGILAMDIRHPLLEADRLFLNYYLNLCPHKPLLVLLTKSDKLSKSHQYRAVESLIKQLDSRLNNTTCLAFSAKTKQGAFEADCWLKGQLCDHKADESRRTI